MIWVPAIKRQQEREFPHYSIWLNLVGFEEWENFEDGVIVNCQISPALRKLPKLLLSVLKMSHPKPQNSAEPFTLTSSEREPSKMKFSLLLNLYFSKQKGRLFQ